MAPGLPPGLLTPDLFAGALGVTNLTAAMANFPTVWGIEVNKFDQGGWGSLTGTSTWDSLYWVPVGCEYVGRFPTLFWI